MRGFGELEAGIMDRAWSSGGPLLVRDIQQTLKPARADNMLLTVRIGRQEADLLREALERARRAGGQE